MEMYNATIELNDNSELNADVVDQLLEVLVDYHPSISQHPRGWQSITISLPAETLSQAITTALAIAERAWGEPAIAVEVMPTAEFDARQGWAPTPELLSVSEAAEALGVTRQAVLQRIGTKSLPATKVGREWAIPAGAVRAAAV